VFDESLTERCKRLEFYETPQWAAEAILRCESFPPGLIVDPCCGTGILGQAAIRAGYQSLFSIDIHDWGSTPGLDHQADFLTWHPPPDTPFSVFANPPFSKAVDFVDHALQIGARKVIVFQRFSWWESKGRRDFWERHPPNRIYICGDRANCWRHDIPEAERGSSSPTAHAWFVWQRGHPPGTLLSHVWRD